MKKVILFILAIAIISCEQEEFTGTGLESLREFELTPVPGARINLNSVDRQGELIISWNQARSGFDSPVTYTWMLDEVGGDFSSPLLSSTSDNDGASTSITFTNQGLDDFLASQGLERGEELEAIWTVSATNGDIIQVADSAVITLRRFVNAIAPFTLSAPADNLFFGLEEGNATSEVVITWDSTFAGFETDVTYQWVADTVGGDFSNPLVSLASDENGIEEQLTITQQDPLDLLDGLPAGTILGLDWKVLATTEAVLVPGNIVAESGDEYTLILVEPTGESKFMVGAATPGGWGWENPTEMFQIGENVWVSYLAFSQEAFRFFEVRDDWGSGRNYPFYLDDEFAIDERFEDAEDNDNNFRFIGSEGFYKITLNQNDKTIVLNAQ